MPEVLESDPTALSPELAKLLEGIASDAAFPPTEGAATALCATDLENARLDHLAQPILLSPALTERVLRLANAATAQRAGVITSVSRAVALLGFYPVKSMALMLSLLDTAPGDSQHALMLRETAQSTAAMAMARELARVCGTDAQRASVQATLCALGRVLTARKMPRVHAEIKAAAQVDGFTENEAARRRLGLGYRQIAAQAATSWRLGPDLCQFLSQHDSHVEGSALAAVAADEIAGLLFAGQEMESARVANVVRGFAQRTRSPAEEVHSALEAGLDDFNRLASTLGFPGDIARILLERATPPVTGTTCADGEGLAQDALDAEQEGVIARILGKLVSNAGYLRAAFFVRDGEGRGWATRACRGFDAEAVTAGVRLPVCEPLNLLSAALERDAGLTIADTRATKIRAALPPWFEARLTRTRCFVLLPLALQGRTVAALYLDRDQPNKLPNSAELVALHKLRDALALAVGGGCVA